MQTATTTTTTTSQSHSREATKKGRAGAAARKESRKGSGRRPTGQSQKASHLSELRCCQPRAASYRDRNLMMRTGSCPRLLWK